MEDFVRSFFEYEVVGVFSVVIP